MQTHFLRFPTNDGIQLQGLLYTPDQPTPKAILHIHGMAGNCYENTFLDSMAHLFTNNNWAFFAINTRGHDYIADFSATDGGKDRRIGNAYEIFEECVDDIKAGLDELEKRGYSTIVLQGHSLGCSKVVYYLEQTNDARVSKLILASPADMVGLAMKEEDNFEGLLTHAEKLVQNGKETELLPKLIFASPDWNGYPLSAQAFVSLSKPESAVDVINTHAPDAPSALNAITVPTFAFLGDVNESVIMEPQKALDILKTKAANCPDFKTAVIHGADHGYADHEDEVAERILQWLIK